ncbi:MAG: DciA family protein [Holosporaceae bacterium]|nr:DciA family protein [Holosporaceae bacterium]
MRIAQFPVAVARIADQIMERNENKPDYLKIFSHWDAIVGEDIASICAPLKAVNLGKDKVLILKAAKGRGLEIQHETCKILDCVHNFLKKNTFSHIRVIQIEEFRKK